jgi:hypothetical protein
LVKRKDFQVEDKKTDKPYPGVNGCAMIPLYFFELEKDDADVIQIADYKKKEEIV